MTISSSRMAGEPAELMTRHILRSLRAAVRRSLMVRMTLDIFNSFVSVLFDALALFGTPALNWPPGSGTPVIELRAFCATPTGRAAVPFGIGEPTTLRVSLLTSPAKAPVDVTGAAHSEKDGGMPASSPPVVGVALRLRSRRLAIARMAIALLGLATLGAVALLWAGAAVRAGRTVFPIDLPIVETLAAHRTGLMNSAARVISTVASPVGLALTLTVLIGILIGMARRSGHQWRQDAWQTALAAVATQGGIGLLESGIKAWVARPRPPQNLAVPGVSARGFAFPSGHTSQSTAVYGLVAVLLCRFSHRRWQRIVVALLAALAIAIVGFARLYLGVHWLSDVLAGWLLGLSWLGVVLSTWTAAKLYLRKGDLPGLG